MAPHNIASGKGFPVLVSTTTNPKWRVLCTLAVKFVLRPEESTPGQATFILQSIPDSDECTSVLGESNPKVFLTVPLHAHDLEGVDISVQSADSHGNAELAKKLTLGGNPDYRILLLTRKKQKKSSILCSGPPDVTAHLDESTTIVKRFIELAESEQVFIQFDYAHIPQKNRKLLSDIAGNLESLRGIPIDEKRKPYGHEFQYGHRRPPPPYEEGGPSKRPRLKSASASPPAKRLLCSSEPVTLPSQEALPTSTLRRDPESPIAVCAEAELYHGSPTEKATTASTPSPKQQSSPATGAEVNSESVFETLLNAIMNGTPSTPCPSPNLQRANREDARRVQVGSHPDTSTCTEAAIRALLAQRPASRVLELVGDIVELNREHAEEKLDEYDSVLHEQADEIRIDIMREKDDMILEIDKTADEAMLRIKEVQEKTEELMGRAESLVDDLSRTGRTVNGLNIDEAESEEKAQRDKRYREHVLEEREIELRGRSRELKWGERRLKAKERRIHQRMAEAEATLAKAARMFAKATETFVEAANQKAEAANQKAEVAEQKAEAAAQQRRLASREAHLSGFSAQPHHRTSYASGK